MRIEAIRAWPRRHSAVQLELDDGATVGDALARLPPALAACAGVAVHGVRAGPETMLRDGDRLELLDALLVDPMVARRQRALRARR